jgi:hypothetical protein
LIQLLRRKGDLRCSVDANWLKNRNGRLEMNKRLRGLIVTCLGVGAVLPLCASAQEGMSSGASTRVDNQVAPTLVGGWQPEAAEGKTRAQVEGELVKAQQDGQLAYLNRTIYAHH